MKIRTILLAGAAALAPLPTLAQPFTFLKSQASSWPSRASLQAVAGDWDSSVFQDGHRAFIGGVGGGVFTFQAGDFSTEAASDPANCAYIANPADATDGQNGVFIRESYLDSGKTTINITDCGAVGDFFYGDGAGGATDQVGTDDAAAIQAAFNFAPIIRGPVGDFRVASTLTLPRGHVFEGANRDDTVLVADHTNGCVLIISNALSQIRDFSIYSTDARWASNDYANDHGVCATDPSDGSGNPASPSGSTASHTQTTIERVNVYGQPGDAVNWVGSGTASLITQSSFSYNKRNGLYFSDGTAEGFSGTTRFAQTEISHINAKDNGGYAVALSTPFAGSGSNYRVIVENLDIGQNAWNFSALNSAFPGEYFNASVFVRGQQLEILGSGIGDTGYANTDMEATSAVGGATTDITRVPRTRVAKAAPATGIRVDNASSQVVINQDRFLQTNDGNQVSPIFVEGGAESITVNLPFMNGFPDYVVEAETNVKGLFVTMGADLLDDTGTGWDISPVLVGSGTTGVLVMEDAVYKIDPAGTGDLSSLSGGGGSGYGSTGTCREITAGGAIALSGETWITVNANGGGTNCATATGDDSDTLSTITGASAGQVLLVEVDGGDEITFENNNGATGSMWLGSDVVLDSAVDKMLLVYNGTKWNALSISSNFKNHLRAGEDATFTISETVPEADTDGIITVTGANSSLWRIASAVAGADQLGCIVGGEVGQIAIIRAADSAEDITYIDSGSLLGGCAAGAQMLLAGSTNWTPANISEILVLYKAGPTQWIEISRSIN